MAVSFLLLLLTPRNAEAKDAKPLWLVICREQFAPALKPLIDQRQRDGFETVVSTAPVDKSLAAAPRRPDYMLLVGDDGPDAEKQPWYLPAKRRRLYRWQDDQPHHFASDTAWGVADGDLLPDFAVGRIPARSPQDVEVVVKKILAFEGDQPSERDLQLPVWSGCPLYGEFIDSVAAGLLLSSLQSGAPGWARPWILTADRKQSYCGWPTDQPDRFCRQVKQGGLCHVLIGHADETGFLSMCHEGNDISLTAAFARVQFAEGPPTSPMILLACRAGNFTYSTRCIAEELLFAEGGPVAAIAATTHSHPLTNYFSGQELLRGLHGENDRIGDLWHESQKRAFKARNFVIEPVLCNVEGKLEDELNVRKIRRDQMLMYALLGDPATQLRMPKPLEATVERIKSGWRWTAQRPDGAVRLHVGLRSGFREWPTPPPLPNERAQANARLERANAVFAFETLPTPLPGQPWAGTIDRPGLLRLVAIGPRNLHVAVFMLDESAR